MFFFRTISKCRRFRLRRKKFYNGGIVWKIEEKFEGRWYTRCGTNQAPYAFSRWSEFLSLDESEAQ